MAGDERLYGLLAEFDTIEAMLAAARRTREAGYRHFEAHSPFPVEEMAEALDFRESRLLWLALFIGLLTTAAGLYFLWYINVVDYPINVGGRPLAAWPAFVLPSLQFSMLLTTVAAIFTMLVMNQLPRLRHPLLVVERFRLASKDRYFVFIESRDPRFNAAETRAFLAGLGPSAVLEVPG